MDTASHSDHKSQFTAFLDTQHRGEYDQQIREMAKAADGRTSQRLLVSVNDIRQFDPKLATQLLRQPLRFLAPWTEVVTERVQYATGKKNTSESETENEEESASVACKMSNENKTKIIIKGNLHTDILMRCYLKKEFNLLDGKRLSHIWHMTTPQLKKPLFITDGALNVLPRIDIKLQILNNAVQFCNKLGIETPKVAILSGTEDPIDSMPSSVEAKKVMELSIEQKINAIVHGPLAFDNAVSIEAAKTKKIENEVAGKADILLVPNLETGNSLSKMMVYFMDACAAGIVIGGKIPVVVPSRADSKISKLASIMAAVVAVKD